jgi:ketosteroid isomerase-like protein
MNAASDPSVERKRLLERDAEWAALASEGRDIDRILSYWTNDAVVFPPGSPLLIGKPAIREYVENSLRIPGFKISWTSSEVNFSPDQELAYIFSENTVTMNGPDGKRVTINGRGVTIWRRELDCVWRCTVDIWNEAPHTSTASERI